MLGGVNITVTKKKRCWFTEKSNVGLTSASDRKL